MAAKKKRTAIKGVAKKKGGAKAKKPKSKLSPKQILSDARADLTQAIEGKKGNGVEVLALSNDGVIGHVNRYLSTRSLAIDAILGVPGLPFGRVIEFYGSEDSGKSTTTLHCMAETQRIGGIVAVIDTENKTDESYAKKLGVKTDDVLIIQPTRKTFESVVIALSAALDNWTANNRQDIPLTIIWDSIAQTPTETELDIFDASTTDDAKARPGDAANHLSRAFRVVTDKLARANALLIVVNQLYSTFARFGKKKTTYGGKAIRHAATMRLEFVRTGWLKNTKGQVLGIEGKCQAWKNNLGAPQLPAEFAIVWGIGIDNTYSVFEKLKGARYITSGGGWTTLGIQGQPDRKFQGGFVGLAGLCQQEPDLFPQLVQIYQAL